MIYVELFWNFLMIGALSFGGGYGMISLVRETVLGHGWLTEGEFLSFIAVSESTPGPLAINIPSSALHRAASGARCVPRWVWCCRPLSLSCSLHRCCRI